MGDPKTDKPGDRAGENRLRGGSLTKDGRNAAADQLSDDQAKDTDQVLRTDDEEDTLYNDGLELENDSRPLKGINGRDDT